MRLTQRLRRLDRRVDELFEREAQTGFERWFARHWVLAALVAGVWAVALWSLLAWDFELSFVAVGALTFIAFVIINWRRSKR